MNPKYFPLTALLAMSCNSSTPKREELHPILPTIQLNCSSLDLTKKVGFSTSFIDQGEKWCYNIMSIEGVYSDRIYNCDNKKKPLPGTVMVTREFTGPRKDFMQLNHILNVSENTIVYEPYWREPSGKIGTFPFVDIPKNIEQEFTRGSARLDRAKNLPEVCQQLLEYKPKQ